jgi:hypothetical protein
MNERIRQQNEQLKQKLQAIADECFSMIPDWNELMLFLELASKELDRDADEWYEKTLWQDKK